MIEVNWETDICPVCDGVKYITDDLCDDCFEAEEWTNHIERFYEWGGMLDDE